MEKWLKFGKFLNKKNGNKAKNEMRKNLLRQISDTLHHPVSMVERFRKNSLTNE